MEQRAPSLHVGHMCIYIYIYTHIYIYICLCTTFACLRICAHVLLQALCTNTHMYVNVYAYAHALSLLISLRGPSCPIASVQTLL